MYLWVYLRVCDSVCLCVYSRIYHFIKDYLEKVIIVIISLVQKNLSLPNYLNFRVVITDRLMNCHLYSFPFKLRANLVCFL